MDHAVKFIVFQASIILPFAAGFLIRKRFADPAAASKKLIRTNLIFFEPLIALWTIWGLKPGIEMLSLPASGFVIALTGLGAGFIIARIIGLAGRKRATFIISSSIANQGFTMGGYLCYLLLGETGLGLSYLFTSYFMLYIFIFIFPFARAAGRSTGAAEEGGIFSLQYMTFYAIILAVSLNLADIKRPAIALPVDFLLIPSIAMYYFALALNFHPADVSQYKRETLWISAEKFIIVPAVTYGILSIIPISGPAGTVIMIQSFMPAAIFSVISSILYDLDVNLASAMFVSNTVIFAIITLPALLYFLSL
jgi:predicted permease